MSPTPAYVREGKFGQTDIKRRWEEDTGENGYPLAKEKDTSLIASEGTNLLATLNSDLWPPAVAGIVSQQISGIGALSL